MAAKKRPAKLLLTTFIPAALLFALVFVKIYHQPLELFPENDTFFDYSTISDGNFEDGNSSTSIDTSDRHLSFNYTLGDKNQTPYAMLVFHAHELFRHINLQQFSSVEITIHPEESSDFKLTVFTYVSGFSDPGNSDTHRPYSIICRPREGVKTMRFPLKDFATPGWWFSAFDLGEEDIPESSMDRITHLSISDATQKKNQPLKIVIEEIRFIDSVPRKLGIALIVALIYLVISYFTFERFRIRRNRKIKQRLYHPGSRTSYNNEEKAKLLTYLSEKFNDPLLTLEKIEKEIGLNQFQVSEIISDTYQMRYKQYLNRIRLDEAKRLLTTTDNPISAIAEEVGYCYSNSFSRAFRQSEDMTPNQYRKLKQDSDES